MVASFSRGSYTQLLILWALTAVILSLSATCKSKPDIFVCGTEIQLRFLFLEMLFAHAFLLHLIIITVNNKSITELIYKYHRLKGCPPSGTKTLDVVLL